MTDYITLILKTLNGSTETIHIKTVGFQQTKIIELKRLVEKKTGLPSESQTLQFTTVLSDSRHGKSMTLEDYGIGINSTITMTIGLEGGLSPGMALLKFADITSEDRFKTIKFSNYAPAWRSVAAGLNFEGVCEKVGCEAYNRNVWIRKGFFESYHGLCDFSYEVSKLKCPMCKSKVKKNAVNGIGFYNCKLRIECQPTGKEEIDYEVESRDKFKYACDSGDDNKISYDYIRMTVKAL